MTKKNTRFAWGTVQQQAFDTLKTSLCQSPVLTTPEPGGKFVLDTDASNEGLGAVLAQVTAKGERVIAYYSRTFSRPEKNYCVTRRELLAVVESVNQFKYYLCGLKFLIRTDHASLKCFLSFREPEGQVARWIERLQEYNFTILHRKGEAHTNADGLSRRPCPTECSHCSRAEDRDHEAVKENEARCRALRLDQPADWATEQQKDQELKDVMEWVGKGQRPEWQEVAVASPGVRGLWAQWDSLSLRDGMLWRRWKEPATGRERWQVVVPQCRRQEVLAHHHGQPGVGHFWVNKTLKRLQQAFYWVTCRREVQVYCQHCDACTARKGSMGQGRAPLQQYQVGAPMDRVAVDVLGPRTPRGNGFVVVVMDYFTKWPEASGPEL
ncbi:hypothetical protein DPEC_G00021660 [Dallia pectoralis]|uniref:Uncharacterized protein n=1 Tax=Dallia pectoralis TaxID=75939 RepID=A0ACC2HGZ2_DALPE|nr:hypothetical protein DPEC_G00021660 [Dallia pectoralis]